MMWQSFPKAMRPRLAPGVAKRLLHSPFPPSQRTSMPSIAHTSRSCKNPRKCTSSANRTYAVPGGRDCQVPKPSLQRPQVAPRKPINTETYQKAYDTFHNPITSPSGKRTYVVSPPDDADAPYDIPSGAFNASSPYPSLRNRNPGDPQTPRRVDPLNRASANMYGSEHVQRDQDEGGQEGPVVRLRSGYW